MLSAPALSVQLLTSSSVSLRIALNISPIQMEISDAMMRRQIGTLLGINVFQFSAIWTVCHRPMKLFTNAMMQIKRHIRNRLFWGSAWDYYLLSVYLWLYLFVIGTIGTAKDGIFQLFGIFAKKVVKSDKNKIFKMKGVIVWKKIYQLMKLFYSLKMTPRLMLIRVKFMAFPLKIFNRKNLKDHLKKRLI